MIIKKYDFIILKYKELFLLKFVNKITINPDIKKILLNA